MSQAVETILSVIENMNLTDKDRLVLIDKLSKTTTNKPTIKPMTEKQLYIRKFERWVVENKILFPPKRF